jgi:hypothetical protein
MIEVVKLQPEDMVLFPIDYGDLIRPPFQILAGRGWGQCTNGTGEFLVVYGPKHAGERSIFDTSPYILPPGGTTPDRWDCDGFYVPSDRIIYRRWRGQNPGPVAVKIWNYRWLTVRLLGSAYGCPWDNGVFEPSQINWAIPNLSYRQLHARIGAP